jgi:Tfp pilus assembly protein PilW
MFRMTENRKSVLRSTPAQLATRYSLPATSAAFTLVELLIGMTLALMLMTAVLSTYVMIARNFTRSLGLVSANQPSLESQARHTLAYFAQDVRMASGLSGTPSASTVTLTLPTGTGTNQVTYYYNSNPITPSTSSDPVTVNGSSIAMQRQALTRCVYNGSTVTTLLLQSSLLTCTINYYDNSGNSYTSTDLSAGNYAIGIKQLSLTFTTQAGSSTNGTLTQVYTTTSPRLLIRNKALLQ